VLPRETPETALDQVRLRLHPNGSANGSANGSLGSGAGSSNGENGKAAKALAYGGVE
jgi:hypothetical protein